MNDDLYQIISDATTATEDGNDGSLENLKLRVHQSNVSADLAAPLCDFLDAVRASVIEACEAGRFEEETILSDASNEELLKEVAGRLD